MQDVVQNLDVENGERGAKKVRIEQIVVDLGDFESVRRGADSVGKVLESVGRGKLSLYLFFSSRFVGDYLAWLGLKWSDC